MKPGDIVMFYSVGPHQRHKAHLKRYVELVSIESARYATVRVVEEKKEVLYRNIYLDQLEPLTYEEESEVQYLKGNDVEIRGSVAGNVQKDISRFKSFPPEIVPILDKVDDAGKRIQRIDLFGGEITVLLEDDSMIRRKVSNPLDHIYALRKWYNLRNQSWGPLEGSV